MAARDEFQRLAKRAGVHPYRRGGKVRMAYDPRTPNETVRAALEAVLKFAPGLVDVWGEPSAEQMAEWRAGGLVPADVCDDPQPSDVDPATVPVSWLVSRASRYHFAIDAAGDGIAFRALDGWQMKDVTAALPAWYAALCKARRGEIVEYVAASAREAQAPEEDIRPVTCSTCGKDATDPETRARLADPVFCPNSGKSYPETVDAYGTVHEASRACPYKTA